MCFYNDCDWYADISTEACIVCQAECKCDECYRSIKPGEWVFTLWQQEHEECRLCYDEQIPHTDKCDLGETFSYGFLLFLMASCRVTDVDPSKSTTGEQFDPSIGRVILPIIC